MVGLWSAVDQVAPGKAVNGQCQKREGARSYCESERLASGPGKAF